jgi:hypothetical protein
MGTNLQNSNSGAEEPKLSTLSILKNTTFFWIFFNFFFLPFFGICWESGGAWGRGLVVLVGGICWEFGGD